MKIASDMALALSFPVGRRFVHVTFHLRAGDDLIQVSLRKRERRGKERKEREDFKMRRDKREEKKKREI